MTRPAGDLVQANGEAGFDPHALQPILSEGEPTASRDDSVGLILVHGRGGDARSFRGLGRELAVQLAEVGHTPREAVVLAAPQAATNSWYPGSFLLPLEQNEPWLSSGLRAVSRCHDQLLELGIATERQLLVGFSQGACLASEFLARAGARSPGTRFAGLVAFTGGVQGPLGEVRRFEGDLAGTSVFLSTGDPDPHVPLVRVQETARIFQSMGARVVMESHVARPHTILPHEIRRAAEVLVESARTSWGSFMG